MTTDQAALDEIERLNNQLNHWVDRCVRLAIKLEESERQRKLLVEQLERIGRGGIDAAVGAGK